MHATNVAVMERELLKVSGEASELLAKTARECEAYEEKNAAGIVVTKGRLMTAEERAAIQTKIDEGKALRANLDRAKGDVQLTEEIARLTGAMRIDGARDDAPRRRVMKSLGQQFVESPAGQFFVKKLHQGSRNWASPSVELHATTLTSNPASGGNLVVPDYQEGIVPLMFKRLTVRDLLAAGTTDSNAVSYMKETTFTNAAAAVAEGAAKPESALVFDLITDLVQKIAHWLPVTEEMLEDVAQIRSYIDARLKLGVELTEEDQLLNGDGIAPNLLGLMNRPGLTAAQPRGTDTNIDAIFKEMMAIFNASFVMPDGHVINPANWATIQLAKDTTGNYLGTGPFAAPQSATLWGLPVAVTPSIVAATALTGAFKSAAQIFDRGGIRVEASNSHQDFFIKNLVAIRAERRLALAVYRPAAFGKTTGLN